MFGVCNVITCPSHHQLITHLSSQGPGLQWRRAAIQSPLQRPGSGETSSEDDDLDDDYELDDDGGNDDLDKSRRHEAAPAPSPTSAKCSYGSVGHDGLVESF